MHSKYDKTIVVYDDNKEVKAVVIFDEAKHLPVFYGVDKFGMDQVLELLGGNKNVLQNSENANIQNSK